MRTLLGVLLVIATLGFAPAAAWACTSDNDCKGDRVCNAGACVAPSAPQACRSDNECPGDLVCNAQHCTAASLAASSVGSPSAAPATPAPPVLGAALPAQPAGVQVSFAPAKNASYQVSVETVAGIRQCIAPCSLAVEPGSRRVQISGDASFTQVIEVPTGGGAFTVEQAPASRKTLWWTMTLGGGAMATIGFYGYGQKNTFLAVVGLAGGGPIFIAGVMGLISGDKGRGQNAIRPRTAALPRTRHVLALEGWGVAPVDGGVGGGAAFSF